MKIFYLHGLESNGLRPDKAAALQKLGLEVIAPVYQYIDHPERIHSIALEVAAAKPDFLIGSSMGGRMGFYLSNKLRIPALLFNPALVHPNIDRHLPVPAEYKALTPYGRQQFILGVEDEAVRPETTLTFLKENYNGVNFQLKIREELAHSIPLEVFEEEAMEFMNTLQNK